MFLFEGGALGMKKGALASGRDLTSNRICARFTHFFLTPCYFNLKALARRFL
jgi:hypothetical protein